MQHYEERLNKVKMLLNRFNLEQLLIQLPSLAAVAKSCVCSITGLLLEEPVTTSEGHTYERKAIEQWITGKLTPTNPITNKPLEKFGLPSHYFQPNWALRDVLVTLHE